LQGGDGHGCPRCPDRDCPRSSKSLGCLVQRVPDVVEAPTVSAGVLRGARRRRDSLKSSRDQTSSVDVTLGKTPSASKGTGKNYGQQHDANPPRLNSS
jgi:hypothetical protein